MNNANTNNVKESITKPHLTKKTREIISLAVSNLSDDYKGDPLKITESVVDVLADMYGTVTTGDGRKMFGEGDEVIPCRMGMGSTKAIMNKVNTFLRFY